jgi:GGDEF domain-containing protein
MKPKERVKQLAGEILIEQLQRSAESLQITGLPPAKMLEVLKIASANSSETRAQLALMMRDADQQALEHVVEEMSDWVDTLEARIKKLETATVAPVG